MISYEEYGSYSGFYAFSDKIQKVTLWYECNPWDSSAPPEYNHLEYGWNTQEKPTVISQQQHWWNNRNWSKAFAYLENGVVTYVH